MDPTILTLALYCFVAGLAAGIGAMLGAMIGARLAELACWWRR